MRGWVCLFALVGVGCDGLIGVTPVSTKDGGDRDATTAADSGKRDAHHVDVGAASDGPNHRVEADAVADGPGVQADAVADAKSGEIDGPSDSAPRPPAWATTVATSRAGPASTRSGG